MPSLSAKLTYDDFLLLPSDGRRHEIIDGEHYVTPSPNTKHQRISMRLSIRLSVFASDHRLGEVFHAPLDVVLTNWDVVEPDLLFVSAGRQSIVDANNVKGAPDLAVEILSGSTRRTDEIVKRKLYEQHGVAEYWIVDPELETIRIFQLVNGRFSPAVEFSCERDEVLTTPLLPGFSLSLSELFA